MADRKTRNVADVAAAEAIEENEAQGLGFDDGIILTTFLLLIGAVLMTYLALSSYPG